MRKFIVFFNENAEKEKSQKYRKEIIIKLIALDFSFFVIFRHSIFSAI
jgi:hypothetical protein